MDWTEPLISMRAQSEHMPPCSRYSVCVCVRHVCVYVCVCVCPSRVCVCVCDQGRTYTLPPHPPLTLPFHPYSYRMGQTGPCSILLLSTGERLETHITQSSVYDEPSISPQMKQKMSVILAWQTCFTGKGF